jgi:pyridoxal phosphate-dependent aminotransferase EpsN
MDECLANGIHILTVIHPEATVAASAAIGPGSVVLANAVLNPDARVGRGVIINTRAVIEHDVEVGDFAHVAPNATTGGAVRIGQFCQIGLGAHILPGVTISAGAVVGAGAVVRHDLQENVIAVGNPARILRNRTDVVPENGALQCQRPDAESAVPKRIYLSAPHMSGREQQFVMDAFATNWVAPVGPHLDLFEAEFAAKLGVKHAVAVSSGTAAMHLAIRHLNLKPEEEVFCSTATFAASVNPIVYEGGSPVFIDSDPSTWTIDCNLLEDELRCCSQRDKLPRAVIAVDLYGQCADWAALNRICGRYEIPLIEDAAEALGATYHDRPAGTFGWANIFSFNGNKIITTSGGGLLASNDAALVASARHLATQARDPAPHYEHSTIGYNYRLSNLLAGVGRAQLQVLDERVQARRRIFEYYRSALEDEPGISFMPEAPYGSANRWLTCLVIDGEKFGATTDEIRLHLESRQIESRPVWKPMHRQPVFTDCRRVGGGVSERLFAEGLCLPSGSALENSDLERVIATFLSVPRRASTQASASV